MVEIKLLTKVRKDPVCSHISYQCIEKYSITILMEPPRAGEDLVYAIALLLSSFRLLFYSAVKKSQP
jgi:hypothetical protein